MDFRSSRQLVRSTFSLLERTDRQLSQPEFSRLEQPQLMRTGVWYGDNPLNLNFPTNWDVRTLWPSCSPVLTESQIATALEHPRGQAPLRNMCRGVTRPLVIIDDVNRPTPVASVLSTVLRHFEDAGISASKVKILLATGMHAMPKMNSVVEKVGSEAASACTIMVHDPNGPLAHLGRTRFGTPVFVNKEVTASDFVIGVGGVYPNHTAGYGGGSKLALGVLGFRSILSLHYSHPSIGTGPYPTRSRFREDLDEIAQMIGMRSMISLHVNADCKPIRIRCGNYLSYYPEEVDFARRTFSVPPPADADVVISNAYPTDLSLTFALMKGSAPLYRCKPESSRVLLASCSEGLGGHGLFPVVNVPKWHRHKTYLRFAAIRPVPFAKKALLSFSNRLHLSNASTSNAGRVWQNPIRVYAARNIQGAVSAKAKALSITTSWSDIVQAIRWEQGNTRRLKVLVYPCAPLITLETKETPE